MSGGHYLRQAGSEPEPEPEPINWSAWLIEAAKGKQKTIEAVYDDELEMETQPEEHLAGVELAKRCVEEGADMAYTEVSADDVGSEEARTALDLATEYQNVEVMRYLQREDATQRLIDACRTPLAVLSELRAMDMESLQRRAQEHYVDDEELEDAEEKSDVIRLILVTLGLERFAAGVPSEASLLARAKQARMDGADLCVKGEHIKGDENWKPIVDLYETTDPSS